jgi:hypothetical protein
MVGICDVEFEDLNRRIQLSSGSLGKRECSSRTRQYDFGTFALRQLRYSERK